MTEERKEFMSLVQQGILKLDTKCYICGSTENLQLHHIIPLSNGGPNIPSNILTLCGECHGKVHDNKGLQLAREKISEKKKGEFILIDRTKNLNYECNGWDEVASIITKLCNDNEDYQYSKVKAAQINSKNLRSKLSKIKQLYPERIQNLEENEGILISNFLYKGNVDLQVITTRRKDGINS